MRFYFDENLGIQLSNGLRAFGEDTCHACDCAMGGVPDEIWLKYIGDQGWILITVDKRIRRRPLEREAMLNHKVGAFFLRGKNMNRWAYVVQLVRAWNKIKEIAAKEKPPFAYDINTYGTEIWKVPL